VPFFCTEFKKGREVIPKPGKLFLTISNVTFIQNLTVPRIFTILLALVIHLAAAAQNLTGSIYTFFMRDSVRVTVDMPSGFKKGKETIITFFALPNGNTTEQTMGKKMQEGDDWHFDIQHIRAQTVFIRQQLPRKNFVVIYLENNYESWPAWKQRHPGFKQLIPHIIDSLIGSIPARKPSIYLNGHSGGGSFIFGYLAAMDKIPASIKRISFLDSDYGYDSSYYPKFKQWLTGVKGAALNVFAYNDSVALYNGKPLVSATGGTWYRSHLLLQHLSNDIAFSKLRDDSIIIYKSADERVQIFFKTNPDRKIFHTQQVELNGFIHSILCGTALDSKKYRYYGERAYRELIK
jgi:hypothetical protein